MSDRTLQPIQFDDVADLYDAYVRTDFDIPFWLRQTAAIKGKVLELACGTGRVSIPLLKAGIDLTCVDYAPGMLAVFQRNLEAHGLSCPAHCQDMALLSLPDRFDLIFIPFHSFSEVLQQKRQRLALLRIRSHLTERGVFICTLQNPAVRARSMNDTWHLVGEFPMDNGDLLLVRSRMIYDPETHVASGKQVYERFSRGRGRSDRRSLEINFHLFQRVEFERLVNEAGFDVTALWGTYEQDPFDESSSPFMVWTLKPRRSDEEVNGPDDSHGSRTDFHRKSIFHVDGNKA